MHAKQRPYYKIHTKLSDIICTTLPPPGPPVSSSYCSADCTVTPARVACISESASLLCWKDAICKPLDWLHPATCLFVYSTSIVAPWYGEDDDDKGDEVVHRGRVQLLHLLLHVINDKNRNVKRTNEVKEPCSLVRRCCWRWWWYKRVK